MKKKKSFEINFGTFLIILIVLFAVVFVIARFTGKEKSENTVENENTVQSPQVEQTESKLYSNNIITVDIGKLSDKWQVVEKPYGSSQFYIQGPQVENEDGTKNDIRINFYIEQSEQTNEELKTQMLEHSIYSTIEYTKIQEINSLQWMEFEAENKGVNAKILTLMKDGYMIAAEIVGETSLYNQYYNEAMRTVMTIQISERIPTETASEVIYQYDTLANIKNGGTQFVLTSLKLPETMEQTPENSNLPEEYKDYVWTGIKYSEFHDAMTKYMTEDVLKSQFSEFIEFNDCLFIKEVNGNQIDYMIEEVNPISVKGNETTYEVVKTGTNNFITYRQNITLKYEDGKCVVSGVDEQVQ